MRASSTRSGPPCPRCAPARRVKKPPRPWPCPCGRSQARERRQRPHRLGIARAQHLLAHLQEFASTALAGSKSAPGCGGAPLSSPAAARATRGWRVSCSFMRAAAAVEDLARRSPALPQAEARVGDLRTGSTRKSDTLARGSASAAARALRAGWRAHGLGGRDDRAPTTSAARVASDAAAMVPRYRRTSLRRRYAQLGGPASTGWLARCRRASSPHLVGRVDSAERGPSPAPSSRSSPGPRAGGGSGRVRVAGSTRRLRLADAAQQLEEAQGAAPPRRTGARRPAARRAARPARTRPSRVSMSHRPGSGLLGAHVLRACR